MRERRDLTVGDLRRMVSPEVRTLLQLAVAAGFVLTITARNNIRLVRGPDVVFLGTRTYGPELRAARARIRRAAAEGRRGG